MNQKSDPLDKCLTKISDWLFKQKYLSQSLDKATQDILGQKKEKDLIFKHKELIPLAHEYVMFDYQFPNGKTGLQMYLEAIRKSITPDELAEIEGFRCQRFSLFKVIEQYPGNQIKVKDLSGEQMHQIQLRDLRGTLIETGSYFLSRLLPFKGKWYISGAAIFYHKDSGYTLERCYRRLHENKTVRITAKDIVDLMENQGDLSWRTGSYERAELELERLLRSWKVKGLSVSDICQEMCRTLGKGNNFAPVINKILQSAESPKGKDMNLLAGVLTRLWNEGLKDKHEGKTPKGKYPIGPMEEQLIHDLLDVIISKVAPDAIPDEEKRQGIIDDLVQDWLHLPQKELNNRTPWQVISDERTKMGNPNREFTCKISPGAIHFRPEGKDFKVNENYSQALKHHKQGNYAIAIDFYKKVLEAVQEDDPEVFRLYGNIGTAYLLLGKKLLADEYLKKALKINPDYQLAREHLSLLKTKTSEELSRQGDYQRLQAREDSRLPDKPLPWDYDIIEKFSNEKIAEYLSRWISGFSLDGFRSKAEKHISSEDLADEEYYPVADITEEDEDFIWIACDILWQRLLPGRPSVEMMVDEFTVQADKKLKIMHGRWGLFKKRRLANISGKILQWLKGHPIWNIIHESSRRQELWEMFCAHDDPSIMEQIEDCIADLCLNHRYKSIIEFVNWLTETVTGEPYLLAWKADSLIALGDTEQGEAVFKETIDKNPDEPRLLFQYGVACLESYPPQIEKAKGILEKALNNARIIKDLCEQHCLTKDIYQALAKVAVLVGDKDMFEHYLASYEEESKILEEKEVEEGAQFDSVIEKIAEEHKKDGKS